MPVRILLAICVVTLTTLPVASRAEQRPSATNNCLLCHPALGVGFSSSHGFARDNCVACHAGDAAALTDDAAHADLIAFPGDLSTAERACGTCHRERVSGVTNGLMHTGHGMVHTTRHALDDATGANGSATLQSLGHGVVDSLLRKQCASCHLGQPKTKHALDVTFDRGGGCVACHINDHPEQGHPALTTRVEDGRCFGCHSRSGRISLSYAGLAEVDAPVDDAKSSALLLADGRSVERLPADVHYEAGLGCIDCHTSEGLMGNAGAAANQRQAVDIECTDCHDNNNALIALPDWPPLLNSMKKHVPFDTTAGTRFLTTKKNGTPLWHIELREEAALLHTKNTGRRSPVPPLDSNSPGHDPAHERLTCAACHSQWAPQCFGCHMEFDADDEQWDHVDRRVTKGRWTDQRWSVNNALPALGVTSDNRIETFVPGMIMTASHPSFDTTKFVRQFAPLSPHTIGKSRSCASCHRSSEALGIGAGQLANDDGSLTFSPARKRLQDGLPSDAWTNISNSLGGRAPGAGQRPFNAAEMRSIYKADIDDGKDSTR